MKQPRTSALHAAAARWRLRADARQRAMLAWWLRCTRRERLLLALCAATTLLLLLWLALLRPAWQALDAVRQHMPQLRRDMTQLKAVVRDAKALQQGHSGKVPAAQVWFILPASLQRAALDASVVMTNRPTSPTDQRWEFSINGAPAAPLFDWLAGLPRMQVRIQTLTLERAVAEGRERPGLINGRIVLTQD